MVTERTLNLSEECGPLPTGHELAGGGYKGNLVLTVEGALSFTEGIKWAVRITKPTITQSGRAGKPRQVMYLVTNEGQSVGDLLRILGETWDTPVEVNEAPDAFELGVTKALPHLKGEAE